jgi:hypothetical protein
VAAVQRGFPVALQQNAWSLDAPQVPSPAFTRQAESSPGTKISPERQRSAVTGCTEAPVPCPLHIAIAVPAEGTQQKPVPPALERAELLLGIGSEPPPPLGVLPALEELLLALERSLLLAELRTLEF